MRDTAVDSGRIAALWAEEFDPEFEGQDASAFTGSSAEESHWRDVIAFSSYARQSNRRSSVVSRLLEKADLVSPHNVRIDLHEDRGDGGLPWTLLAPITCVAEAPTARRIDRRRGVGNDKMGGTVSRWIRRELGPRISRHPTAQARLSFVGASMQFYRTVTPLFATMLKAELSSLGRRTRRSDSAKVAS